MFALFAENSEKLINAKDPKTTMIMTNCICDIFLSKQASISTNYHSVRDY